MAVLLLIVSALVGLFAFVLLFGAPYLPTLGPQRTVALELLALKPGQTLIELGSGDGTMLITAAEQGLTVVGYELNPLLVIISRLRTWRYRRQVRVVWGNFWRHQWPEADGIFTFLLDKYMEKLDKKITQNYKAKKIKLASYAFKIPGKKINKEHAGVYLYTYK